MRMRLARMFLSRQRKLEQDKIINFKNSLKTHLMTSKEFILKKKKEVTDGKAIYTSKDIARNGKRHWIIEARTMMLQSNHTEKVFVFERMKFDSFEGTITKKTKKGAVQYRIGYYIVGKIGRMNGKWTWGQYCPTIPIEDFNKLISLAREEKTLL